MRLQPPIAFASLLIAGLASAESADVNVISKVDIQDSGGAVVVSIRGTKPPNFTTFSMMDPPRFVIDFSESTFRGVPEDIPVNGGIITVIKNLSYGSDATSIARVMLAFGKEVDPPDVQTVGNTLQVKVAKPGGGGPAVVAEAPAAAATPSVPDVKVKADADAKAKADAEAQAKADADARKKAQEDERKAEAKAKADAEAQAKADADAKKKTQAQAQDQERKAQADAKAKADADAQAKADADTRQKADDDRARAEAKAKVKADEDQRRAQADADAKAKADQDARAQADARERQAAEKAERDRAAERERLAAADKPRPEEPAVAPAAPAPAPAPAAQNDERLDVSTGPSQLREVGFRQMADVSRVFVRTNHPARYTISEASENAIRVELSNTRVKRRNDTRLMDTSFFPSAVAAVTPRREGSSYVLEIKLRQRVPYQQKVEGDMLAIDFERPAGMRGGSDAAAPAPAKKAAQPEPIDPSVEQPGAN